MPIMEDEVVGSVKHRRQHFGKSSRARSNTVGLALCLIIGLPNHGLVVATCIVGWTALKKKLEHTGELERKTQHLKTTPGERYCGIQPGDPVAIAIVSISIE